MNTKLKRLIIKHIFHSSPSSSNSMKKSICDKSKKIYKPFGYFGIISFDMLIGHEQQY